MIPPFHFWCQKVMPLVYDDSLSYYETLCKVVDKLNQCIQSANNVETGLNQFMQWVYSECVTHNQMETEYMLDRNGNFTGTIYGLPASTVGDNRDRILYILDQLNNGNVPRAIDGGYFTDSGINNIYNGGLFS